MSSKALQDKKHHEQAQKTERMGTESIFKLLLEFGIPATVGLLVNALYNIVDSIFIGQGVGEIGIAAATASYPAMILMMACGMLVGGGGNALMAIKLGEKRYDQAERILGNAFTLVMLVAALVTTLGLVFLEPILRASGATPEVMGSAKTYLSIILIGMVVQAVGFGLNNFIRTTGNPRRAMSTMLIGAAVNIVLDYIFIMKFGWGVAGAAWATVIGQSVSAIVVVMYFRSKKTPIRLRLSCLKLDLSIVRSMLGLGFASFVMQTAASVVNVVLNSSLVGYGALATVGASNALAGMGVVTKTAMFFLMPIMGFVMAAQPLIGFNYGAQKFDRVKQTFKTAAGTVTVFLTLFWAIIQIYPHFLTSLFGLTGDGVSEFAAGSLRIFLLLMPFIGFQMMGANYFQSTGQPVKSAILSLSRQVLFLIPAILIVPWVMKTLGYGPDAVLYGVVVATPISDSLSTMLTAAFIFFELSHLDASHARKLTPHDLDGDGVESLKDYEEVTYLPPTEL